MSDLQQFQDYVYRFPSVNNCEKTLNVLLVHVESIKQNEIEFDLIGLKPFVANALRQILLNEIPGMAIEEVYFHKNTSLFNCDYVSQRLALIPIKADPNYFKFRSKSDPERLNSDNCIVLKLNKKNTQKKTIKVYSKDLIWEPVGLRQQSLPQIEALFPNIPILCLNNNEEISCKIHCFKGRGIDHMKYSPGFAYYCFHSQIKLFNVDKISVENAKLIQSSFPPGVINLETWNNGRIVPVVANERLDRHTRSFKNYPEVEQCCQVKYYRDHLIFIVESHGILDPVRMVTSALNIMIYKYETWKETIQKYKQKYEKTYMQQQ